MTCAVAPPDRRNLGPVRRTASVLVTSALVVMAGSLITAACTTTSGPTDTGNATDRYRLELAAICVDTAKKLDATIRPPDATISEFGTAVSAILTDEAEQARDLDPPSDDDADHRAFVLNTDQQAAAWTRLADSADAELADVTADIAALALGRDDLIVEMGIDECRRAAP